MGWVRERITRAAAATDMSPEVTAVEGTEAAVVVTMAGAMLAPKKRKQV